MSEKTCVNVLVNVPGIGNRPYSYYLPPGVTPVKGLMVSVPFGQRKAWGFILGETLEPEAVTVKDICGVCDPAYLPPVDLIEFGEKVAGYYAVPIASVWACLWPPGVPLVKSCGSVRRDASLRKETLRGGNISNFRCPGESAIIKPLVVRGSSSFRFGVFVEQIRREVSRGCGVLFLVPEVRAVQKLKERLEPLFGDTLAEVHSGMSDKRRREEWLSVMRGEKRLVIGTRLGIFAPVRDLSLIILDLAEDDSFKAEDHPRYDARTVAVMRARFHSTRVITGFGRFPVSIRFGLDNGAYELLDEGPRYPGDVQVIEARKYLRRGRLLSWKMVDALKECFDRGGRAFLFLNQRGYGRSLFCGDCGYIPVCERCSVVLSFHSGSKSMVCHVCGYSAPVPATCPRCGGYSFKPRGFGTERLEEEFLRIFPEIPVFRLDADTARAERPDVILGRFFATAPACLVGTEMAASVASAYAQKPLQMVAVPLADSRLGVPGFNVEEQAFLTLSRLWDLVDERTGAFVLQAFDPSRRSIRWIEKREEDLFYAEEMEDRKSLGYPPFGVLARIEVAGKTEGKVREKVSDLAERLRAEASEMARGEGCVEELTVLGPAPCLKEKVRGAYRWHILLKGPDRGQVTALAWKAAGLISEIGSGTRIIVDIDPVQLI